MWYIKTTGLTITIYESQKGSAAPFSPPLWLPGTDPYYNKHEQGMQGK